MNDAELDSKWSFKGKWTVVDSHSSMLIQFELDSKTLELTKTDLIDVQGDCW